MTRTSAATKCSVDLPALLVQQLERLAAAGIQIVPAPGLNRFFLLEKDGYFALVEKRDTGFGHIGSPGIMTESGFAPLIQSGAGCSFVCKGYSQPASLLEAEAAHGFFTQLKQALS
jgi:hypothetical protein